MLTYNSPWSNDEAKLGPGIRWLDKKKHLIYDCLKP